MAPVLLGMCSILEFLLSFLVGKAYHRGFFYNSMDFKTIEHMIWFSEILEGDFAQFSDHYIQVKNNENNCGFGKSKG